MNSLNRLPIVAAIVQIILAAVLLFTLPDAHASIGSMHPDTFEPDEYYSGGILDVLIGLAMMAAFALLPGVVVLLVIFIKHGPRPWEGTYQHPVVPTDDEYWERVHQNRKHWSDDDEE